MLRLKEKARHGLNLRYEIYAGKSLIKSTETGGKRDLSLAESSESGEMIFVFLASGIARMKNVARLRMIFSGFFGTSE